MKRVLNEAGFKFHHPTLSSKKLLRTRVFGTLLYFVTTAW